MFNIAKTLNKRKNREETGLFLIEGHREIELAVKNGIEIVHTFDRTNTTAKNLERITYCGDITAVAKIPHRRLQDFEAPDNPLIIILDELEKPGNIGAIIRTADAAGVSAVIICGDGSGGSGDITNPNLIRASLGAVFSLPVYCTDCSQTAIWLAEKKIPIITASPDARKIYSDYDYTEATAIVIGSEADGVSLHWKKAAEQSVTIPMFGGINSLNASVSAAILIYEAVRQRLLVNNHK